MPSVLIVDDLLSIHEMLGAVIQPTGIATAFATDGEKALVKYKAERFDLVLADIDMKPMDGITLLKNIKAYDPNCVLVIMTAYASTDSAIQALKFGAFDYLRKPFRVDELLETLKRGLEFRQFQMERLNAVGDSKRSAEVEAQLVGSSSAMQKLVQQVKKLAMARTPVLLQGEPGTGKSKIAELLHASGNPPGSPLVRIDCSMNRPEQLSEGLLGASAAGGTWVQQAKGGTLFLEHLQSLPFELQEKLVSVLRSAGPGFRLVCSCEEDLEKLVDEGKFNDELFYRVASLPLHLPPLRARAEDIPLLVRHFTAEASNPLFDAKLVEFSPEAMAVLSAYRWPGNLAELAQVVIKIAATTETRVVGPDQLPLRLRELKQWPALADFLAAQQKIYVDQVLHACQGDRAKAAAVLGIDVSKLGS